MPDNNTGQKTPDVTKEFNNAAKKDLDKQAETGKQGKLGDDLEKRPYKPQQVISPSPTGGFAKQVPSSPPVDAKQAARDEWQRRQEERIKNESLSEKFNREKEKDRAKTDFNRAGKDRSNGGREI